jgi:lipopolysaccharide/colanic/teichoic acid biosynthesis glycosyltransferase
MSEQKGLAFLVKKTFDRAVASGVRMTVGSRAFFTKARPGLRDRALTIYKLRTMLNERRGDGALLPHEARSTRIGGWVSSTSIGLA